MWSAQALLLKQTSNLGKFSLSLPSGSHRKFFCGLVFVSLNGSLGDDQRRLLQPSSSQLEQIRGRKRSAGKQLSKQQKMERRAAREEKERKRKEHPFMQKIKIRRANRLVSLSEQGPGRYDAEKEAELKGVSECGVSIRAEHKTRFYTIEQALEMHRQMQRPAMYNRPSAPVKLRIELNMNTEKSTKTITASEEIVPISFPFFHKEKRTILAFVADKQKQEEAVEAGAEIAVGPEMVKKILKGQFNIQDFDFCVGHSDMATSLTPLRGLLKSRCPTKQNGGLSDDLPSTIKRFLAGVKLEVKVDPIHPEWGIADPVVGLLSLPDEEIKGNIATILEALCKHRSAALGPFVNRAVMMVIPGSAHFAIDVSEYMPKATEEEFEKMESRKKKKKKAKAAPVVEQSTTEADVVVDEMEHLITLM